jgi:hypothetical protein
MAMSKRKRGASMAVKVTVDGVEHEVSNTMARALFGPKPESRVFPVTTKVTAAQRAWLIECAAASDTTPSALIASLINKEMQDGCQ